MHERFRRAARTWTLLLGAFSAFLYAADVRSDEPYREDAVKATFLFRFTSYVEWPPEALRTAHFTIATIGADDIAAELERVLPRRFIQGLPAHVRKIRAITELGDAQVLYIGAHYRGDVRRLIAEVRAMPVLSVTDHAAGLDHGSIINFLLVDRRVRFEISLSAASHAHLKVGADLLAVATRVRGAPLRSQVCERTFLTREHSRGCMLRMVVG